jgi:ATP-dependent protease ClpP protease subunit
MSKHGMKIEGPIPTMCNVPNWFSNWMATNKREFAVNKSDDKRSADIMLFDVIGEGWWGGGISATRFAEQLAMIGDVEELRVLINSPGGLIGDGMAIYTSLVEHPAHVITQVTGMAASAASFVLQAGDERVMGETTQAFVHPAQGMTMGDDILHEKTASELRKSTDTIALLYARRSGRKPESFVKLMRDEMVLSADEALAEKLIDRIIPAKRGSKNQAEQKNEEAPPVEKPVEPKRDLRTAAAARLRMLELDEEAA